jgi:hypothetical protein
MQAVLAVVPSLFGAGAAGLASTVGTISTVIGGIGALSQMGYQKQVAENAAQVADANAKRASFSGQVNAQDADLAAASVLADLTDRQASSGFAVSSPSFARTRSLNRVLARRDSLRIANDAQIEAQNYSAQAATTRAEAKTLSSPLNVLGVVADTGASLISGAAMVKKDKAAQLNRTRVV